MNSEIFRPTNIQDVFGHMEAKESLKKYLTSPGYEKCIILSGSPGIGKTTLALAAAISYGFEPFEINASKAIRSYEDVEKIKESCKCSVNIYSFLREKKKTCVILDEIDGSDPHAQGKVISWIKDSSRKVPIICTCNEVPTIFKRNSDFVEIIRCFPPRASEIENIFPNENISELLKECQYDIRRISHRLQYGKSDTLPKLLFPPTGLPIEKMFILRQAAFGMPDLLHGYRVDKQDISHLLETTLSNKTDDIRDCNIVSGRRRKKLVPDK